MKENYLAKWLNNELSEQELADFQETDEYASYVKILKVSKNLKGPEFNMDQALNDVINRRTPDSTKVVKLNPWKNFMRVAAVTALLLTGAYFYLNSLDETISTEFAERSTVTLPDNSEVVLNAATEVSYNAENWDEDRNVTLQGEAFFKVAKGKRFTVATANGTVTVLGTQFNVENRAGFFEVTCYEGLVSVTYQGQEKKLPAGTSFLVVHNTIVQPEAPSTSKPSWLLNESRFKSIPISFVLDELERQYNIKVTTKDIDTNTVFTGSFSNTDIDLALRSISTPSGLKYNLEGNNVLFYAENTP